MKKEDDDGTMILDDSASREGVDSRISAINHVYVNKVNINHPLRSVDDF
jgi:hypothetical protein